MKIDTLHSNDDLCRSGIFALVAAAVLLACLFAAVVGHAQTAYADAYTSAGFRWDEAPENEDVGEVRTVTYKGVDFNYWLVDKEDCVYVGSTVGAYDGYSVRPGAGARICLADPAKLAEGSTVTIPATVDGVKVTSAKIKGWQSKVDLSEASNLKVLEVGCANAKLGLAGCKSLRYLSASMPNATKVALPAGSKLVRLDVYGGKLKAVDTSKCKTLLGLGVALNERLASVLLPASGSLKDLDCSGCRLSALNLSKCKNLVSLSCGDNRLKKLNVSKCAKLRTLDCSGNKLKALALGKNKRLVELACGNNSLTKLNVSKNKKLQRMNFSYNRVKTVALAKGHKYKQIVYSHNKLSKAQKKKIRAAIA